MIHYIVGDATDPQVTGPKIIAHVCNDIGRWGSGFVLSVSKRWPEPERRYRQWYAEQVEVPDLELLEGLPMGDVQFVDVGNDIVVANMIAQAGVSVRNGVPPIRYDALDSCLVAVAQEALRTKASVHMPRIGCGLAGGKWSEVELIVNRALVKSGVQTYVYDFDTKDHRTIRWKP